MVSFRLQPNYPILRNLKEIVAILLSLVQPLTKKGFKSERFFVIFPDICFNITQRPFGKKICQYFVNAHMLLCTKLTQFLKYQIYYSSRIFCPANVANRDSMVRGKLGCSHRLPYYVFFFQTSVCACVDGCNLLTDLHNYNDHSVYMDFCARSMCQQESLDYE